MPSGQSDTEPQQFIESRGKTQVLYNIQQTDDGWAYDYVEISGNVTKPKIFAAIHQVDAENNTSSISPDDISTQINNSKEVFILSDITSITYAQLDTYIENNVTDLASAKEYLKKLSKVVLAHIKIDDLD